MSAAAQAQKLPAGFVYLRDVDPTIIQDIRYAGSNNFVGRPLAGYEAAECVVKREVGRALKSVQEELALQNLSLKMFDCYRPTRAVADMVAWSRDGKETAAGKRYNPAFSKADLFRLGYIADPFGPFHRRRARPHFGRSEGRQFGHLRSRQGLWRLHRQREAFARRTAASTWAPATTVPTSSRTRRRNPSRAAQRRWREKLVLVMARRGFVNYSKEWWHFSLPGAGGQAYDFPIRRGK